jgi:hypothetical protein
MKPLKVELYIDGKKKTIVAPFVPLSVYRTLVEMETRINLTEMKVDELDEFINLICSAFGNKFTVDEFYNGFPANEFKEFFAKFYRFVVGIDEDMNEEKTEGEDEKSQKK